MTDVVDKVKRSQMMAGIRGKDTKPERVLRATLHSAGFRYRVHVTDLPGTPDLVFTKYKAVILAHGCFWHRHSGCWWATTPSSNTDFWSAKFEENVRRDIRNLADLEGLGWRVAIVWECALRLLSAELLADSLREWLASSNQTLVLPADRDKRPAPITRGGSGIQPDANGRKRGRGAGPTAPK